MKQSVGMRDDYVHPFVGEYLPIHRIVRISTRQVRTLSNTATLISKKNTSEIISVSCVYLCRSGRQNGMTNYCLLVIVI